jgi:hypothetical protein
MADKKDKFTFGDILGESIQEYKNNFREILKFMLLFVGIPALILCIFQFVCIIIDPKLFALLSTPSLLKQLNTGLIKLPLYYQIVSALFNLITIFLMVFISAGFISTLLKKSKFTSKELIRNAQPRYWKFFAFNIVLIIFLILLFLLLIVPGIIFGIYWVFASYVFFDRKEKIRPSLKQSREIVKNRWWKTFGYFLLICIIIGFISLVINIIQFPTVVISGLHIFNDTPLSLGFLGIFSLMNLIARFCASLVTVPLGILFFKNFYLKMKKE